VKGSGGGCKARFRRADSGKSGDARVIYFNRVASGEIWLLAIYAKANTASIPAYILNAIKEEIENA
jgi:hypothetical protein